MRRSTRLAGQGRYTIRNIGLALFCILSLLFLGSSIPARAQNTSWATSGNHVQYTTSYSYSVQGLSNYPAQSFTTNTTLLVLSASGNSVKVRITTNAPSYYGSAGSSSSEATFLLDKPFPSTAGQFGLALPLYCPPGNLTACTSQVGLGWQGSLSGLSGFYSPTSSGTPHSTISDSNTQTVVGSVKASTLSVSESWSFNPTGTTYSVNFQGSESGSYDSVLGLLTAGSSTVSETYQISYGGSSSSGTINVGSSTKMANTNINSWTPGSTTPTIPWFLFGIIAAAGVAVVVAVIAMARRRGKVLAQPVGSTVQSTAPSPVVEARPIFCGKCGTQNSPDSAFCGKCGANLN